jgi:hypothetical protein
VEHEGGGRDVGRRGGPQRAGGVRAGAHLRVFTEGINTWWPLKTHSIGEDRAESVRIEPRVGGLVVGTLLEHRYWERHGGKASEERADYDAGWQRVLGAFAEGIGKK